MPKGLAVAALTTAGYSGILAGPAAIGFLSKGSGLHNAFWFLAALFVCPPLLSKYVAAVAHWLSVRQVAGSITTGPSGIK